MKTIEHLFRKLRVKFTRTYLSKLYHENPYRDTLFGVSNILSEYSIEHLSVKMKDVEELKTIEPPLMVNMKGKNVLIDSFTGEEVSFWLEDQKVSIPFERFVNVWDKVVLVAEATLDSGEPDYKKHQKEYWSGVVRKYTFVPAFLSLTIAGLGLNSTYASLGVIFLLFLHIVGIYIGWLLLQKQQYISNRHADKICSMLKNGNCNRVLASPAAKIMGVVGWSEIGLAYFVSNTFITLFSPHLIPYLALINILGLPYSIWSVWYQKYKVKQWCFLCLIVQILLWMVFIVNISFGHITLSSLSLLNTVLVVCIYILPLLIINTLLPKLNKERYAEYLEEETRRLKLKPEVFRALLHQQMYFEVDFSVSRVLFGNKDANLVVTIVTNPHCLHCAMMHKQVEQLLSKANNEICVQYIFHSSREEYEASSAFLVSVYLSEELGDKEKREVYDTWFKEGRTNKDDFFKRHSLNTDTRAVDAELQSHKQWKGIRAIDGTPTVFVNGYELPRQYRVEELVYFLDLKI